MLGTACWLLVLLLSSSEAQATCGDYLHSKNMRGHGPIAAQDTPFSEFESARNSDGKPDAPMPTSPCNGPNCQRQQPHPSAPGPAPEPVMSRVVDEAMLNQAPALNWVLSGVAYHEAAVCASEGFAGRVERPPRD